MKTGLDRLKADPSVLKGRRPGLLAHPASVTRELAHAIDVVPAKVLYGPEHGWAGHAQDMIEVDSGKIHNTRVVSLYGDRFEDLSPKKEDLADIDVMVIDLQDVGARYYTFVWTAVLVARACRDAGVSVIVLDRPNPIGRSVEGILPKNEFLSFVGLEPLPVRHGLTIGEIVKWRARVEGYADLIEVIGVEDLPADAHAPAWDRPFVMPSPNMPTYETALVYPGGCLLEGTNLSDGRGTTRPFEITGAPWIDGQRLSYDLTATKLPGFFARPLTFEPTFHKHGRKTCGGVQIHVLDPQTFRPYATYLALIALAQKQRPDLFAFRTERYEFIDTIPAFDILTGSDVARKAILADEDARAIADALSVCGQAEADVVAAARA